MTRRWTAAGVAAVLVLAGCGPSSRLTPSPEGADLCTPAQRGDAVLIAHNPLANEGSEEAVLRDVTLVDGTNLEVMAFDVLAHGEDGFRGVGPLVPLSDAVPEIAVDEEVMVRVAVKLVDPSTPGEAAAFDVEYSDPDDHRSELVRTTVTMRVLPQGQTCL